MVSNFRPVFFFFFNTVSLHLTPFKAVFFFNYIWKLYNRIFFKKQKFFMLNKHIASTCQFHLSVLQACPGKLTVLIVQPTILVFKVDYTK